MGVFKAILKIVIAFVCGCIAYVNFNLGGQSFEDNNLFSSLVFYALAGVFAIAVIVLIISFFKGIASGAKEAIDERREESGSSRRSSSSRYSSSGGSYSSSSSYEGSSSGLKEPDGRVELNITQTIDRRLPSCTPSTHLSCDICGKTAYLRGHIHLWNSRDAGRVESAVRSGFLEAMRDAAREGYDVGGINLSTDVSIGAADKE